MSPVPPSVPVRFQRPSFPPPDAIERHFARSRERRWFSNGGPCFDLLVRRLTDRTGRAAFPVSSATLGLVVAISRLRRRNPGTEALVPSFTFAATAQAAVWNGLQPVFVDVDQAHWHLCPDALGAALAERREAVSVVVACSSFGTPPPSATLAAWEEACRSAGVPLLVDSAAGFGAVNDEGLPIGAQGDAEVVSFHATKPFAIGEGGAVFSRDPELMADISRAANFTFGAGERLPQDGWGINAKLDELHAATALAVLEGFDEALAIRRRRAAELISLVGPGLSPQQGHERGTFQFVPVAAFDAALRDEILRRAVGRVELRTHYEPLHRSSAFATAPRAGTLAVTDDLVARMLSLPMFADMTDDELATVAAVVSGGSAVG